MASNNNYDVTLDPDYILMKKDIVGNVVFAPNAPFGQCYFYVEHCHQRNYLNDLSIEFDVRDELNYDKRMQRLIISLGRYQNEDMYIFSRVVRGTLKLLHLLVEGS